METADGTPVRTEVVLDNFERIISSLGNKLEKEVLVHLKNVYSTMTICLLIAVIGVATNFVLHLHSLHLWFTIAKFVLIFVLHLTPPIRENDKKRLFFLYGLSFLIGLTTSPLVQMVVIINPKIVFNAYLVTLVVFASFSVAALYAESTKFLGMGGFLSSAALILLITSIFTGYEALYPVILWAGLCVNSLLILYDTQLICEKRRRGDCDHIKHTMDLFIDFVGVFRYLILIIKGQMGDDQPDPGPERARGGKNGKSKEEDDRKKPKSGKVKKHD
jgi:FtsH-binding integral membrane protein